MRIAIVAPTSNDIVNEEGIPVGETFSRRNHRASIGTIVDQLKRYGHQVDYPDWGNLRQNPDYEVREAWGAIRVADHVVACPTIGQRPSRGVHIAIGWATALDKPVTVLALGHMTSHSRHLTGLCRVFDVEVLFYTRDPIEVLDPLLERLSEKPDILRFPTDEWRR